MLPLAPPQVIVVAFDDIVHHLKEETKCGDEEARQANRIKESLLVVQASRFRHRAHGVSRPRKKFKEPMFSGAKSSPGTILFLGKIPDSRSVLFPKDYLLSMGDKDVKALVAKGIPVHHATLDEKYALYVPFGHIIIERNMGPQNIQGLRLTGVVATSPLLKVLENTRIFKELLKNDTTLLQQLVSEACGKLRLPKKTEL